MESTPIKRLFELIARLRGENGCPWDRAQTVESILSDLVDEAYELQWARARGDAGEVFEESGDVLFVLSFAIALVQEEDPSFTIDRIAEHAYEKIKRRHPHVFGDAVATNATESVAHWDRIKAEEKNGKTSKHALFADVPGNLSSIRRADKIQKRAAQTGFDWDDPGGIIAKIREEVGEVEELIAGGDTERITEEIGDLYFSVVNLSRFLGIDGEAALTGANAKFIERYQAMEELARQDGRSLDGMTLEEMDRYWDKAKEDT
jgi:tetrapyrrole methylase family protein/MazG family protein